MRNTKLWIAIGVVWIALIVFLMNLFILKNTHLAPHSSMPARKSNQLLYEKSPYLLAHAYDPVDWHPWGETAFEEALKTNKPIFLSIGYASCFACYTMQREVFQNEKIANQMNQDAVNILVDREERPDVDRLYMTAIQTLTGSGGWPMSLFLTPERKPFYGATYLSPAAFTMTLSRVHEVWEKDPQKLSGSGDLIAGYLEDLSKHEKEKSINESSLLSSGYAAFRQLYDSQYGGFGSAPKFPHAMILSFLLRYYDKTGEKTAIQMTEKTLQQMHAGGIYDHLGFGFHRYSADEQWRTPHFEKMLYDQALLTTAYLEAYQVTHDPEYSDIAKSILVYAQREMMSPEGGFYGAEDAASSSNFSDPAKSPGTFYTWTKSELDQILGSTDSPVFCYLFGVRAEGNSLRDPLNILKNANVLFTAHSEQEAAIKFNRSQTEIHTTVERCLQKLLDHRQQRPHPIIDDKVILSWNALMISAFAKAYEVLGDKSYLDTALRCNAFLSTHLYSPKDQRLLRRYRAGEARIEATLQDYAFYVQALLDLYEASFQIQLLQQAIALNEQMVRLFYDSKTGAFFDTSANDESLPVRTRDFNDDSEPSGNSIAMLDLLRISEITGSKKNRDLADRALHFFAERAAEQPEAMPQFLTALNMSLEKPKHIIIAGRTGDPLTKQMLREIRSRFLPDRIILLADGSDDQKFLAKLLPVIANTRMLEGKPTVYVCEDLVCKLPTSDPQRLAEMLDNKIAQ